MNEHEEIFAAGERRIFNLRPSPPNLRELLKAAPEPPVIPDASIQSFDISAILPVKVKDQGSYGACVGHSTASSLEFALACQGIYKFPLSAWFPYAILCNGVDRGASILESLQLIETKGCAPESDVPYGTINPIRLSQQSYADALNFRLEVGAELKTWEQIRTAVALNQAVVLSVRAGANWSNVGGDFAPPVNKGPGNHAVFVGGGISRSPKWGLLLKMQNSWGTSWGDKGYCWLAQAHIESVNWFEAFTAKAVVTQAIHV